MPGAWVAGGWNDQGKNYMKTRTSVYQSTLSLPPDTFSLEGGTWHPHLKPHYIPFVRDCCSPQGNLFLQLILSAHGHCLRTD